MAAGQIRATIRTTIPSYIVCPIWVGPVQNWQSKHCGILKLVNPTKVSDRMNNPVDSVNSLWLALPLTEIPTFQVACSLLAFVIRYPLALFFYGEIVA